MQTLFTREKTGEASSVNFFVVAENYLPFNHSEKRVSKLIRFALRR